MGLSLEVYLIKGVIGVLATIIALYNNLFTTYLLIELVSVCAYIIITASKSISTIKGSLLYFIYGALSSVLLGWGLVTFYSTLKLGVYGLDFYILFFILIKLGVFPFIFWVYKVYNLINSNVFI